MSGPDRTKLPIRRPEFRGTLARTLGGSEPDWTQIDHVHPPAGAPNVLVVLIDDAGFGNPRTFGGPIDTPNYSRMAEGGLRYNRFHVTALCSPTRAALLTGRNSHTVGFGSVGEFAGRFPRVLGHCFRGIAAPLPRILRENGYSTAAFGKWHLTPDGQQGAAGPFDRWPNGWGFDYFYGFWAVAQPVGPVPGREPEDHRHGPGVLRPGEPVLPSGRDGRQDDRVAARRPGAGRAQAVLRLLLHRVQPRPAPCVERPGPTSTRASSTRVGTGCARRSSRGRRQLGVDAARRRADAQERGVPGVGTTCRTGLKAYYARQMEVYAGYSENADHNVGRVIDAIEELGELDNTLIIWIWGDNGASMEGTHHRLVQRADHAERHPAHRRDADAARRALRGHRRPGAAR